MSSVLECARPQSLWWSLSLHRLHVAPPMMWEKSSSSSSVFFVFLFYSHVVTELRRMIVLQNPNMIISCSLFSCLSVLLSVATLRTLVVCDCCGHLNF
jgi:hypothetical protein